MDDRSSAAPPLAAIDTLKRKGTGLCIILFPIMLLIGFLSHPNILSLEVTKDVTSWTAEWRGNFMFHLGHLFVLFAVPPIIVAVLRFMSLPRERGAWYGFIGGVLGVFGAFMLAVDKGALTLVLTAFQTVPSDQFDGITPALQTVLDRAGWLWITWAFVALPLGVIVQMIGLLREQIIPRWRLDHRRATSADQSGYRDHQLCRRTPHVHRPYSDRDERDEGSAALGEPPPRGSAHGDSMGVTDLAVTLASAYSAFIRARIT